MGRGSCRLRQEVRAYPKPLPKRRGFLFKGLDIPLYIIAIIVCRRQQGDVGRNLRCTGAISNSNSTCLYTNLVPQTSSKERLMGLAATLDDERLDALLIEVVDELGQGALVCQRASASVRY